MNILVYLYFSVAFSVFISGILTLFDMKEWFIYEVFLVFFILLFSIFWLPSIIIFLVAKLITRDI